MRKQVELSEAIIETLHKHFLNPATLDPAIVKRYYPKKDFHMVYYGEILGIYKQETGAYL